MPRKRAAPTLILSPGKGALPMKQTGAHTQIYTEWCYIDSSYSDNVPLYTHGICTVVFVRSRPCLGSERNCFWKWIRNGIISNISFDAILNDLPFLRLANAGRERFGKSLQYLQGFVIDNNAFTRVWNAFFGGAICFSHPLTARIFWWLLGFRFTRIGDNGFDETLVRLDTAFLQKPFDRCCRRRRVFFLGDVFFNKLSKISVFFSQGLKRLFQLGC